MKKLQDLKYGEAIWCKTNQEIQQILDLILREAKTPINTTITVDTQSSGYFIPKADDTISFDIKIYNNSIVCLSASDFIIPPLPEKWYLKVTSENIEEINKWRTAGSIDTSYITGYVLSKYYDRKGHYVSSKKNPILVEYSLITTEQFFIHVLKKDIISKKTITRGNLIKLYKADNCTKWRKIIKYYLDEYSTESDDYRISIRDIDLQTAEQQCNSHQKSLLKQYGIECEPEFRVTKEWIDKNFIPLLGQYVELPVGYHYKLNVVNGKYHIEVVKK
jgi:hypothetical protein